MTLQPAYTSFTVMDYNVVTLRAVLLKLASIWTSRDRLCEV